MVSDLASILSSLFFLFFLSCKTSNSSQPSDSSVWRNRSRQTALRTSTRSDFPALVSLDTLKKGQTCHPLYPHAAGTHDVRCNHPSFCRKVAGLVLLHALISSRGTYHCIIYHAQPFNHSAIVLCFASYVRKCFRFILAPRARSYCSVSFECNEWRTRLALRPHSQINELRRHLMLPWPTTTLNVQHRIRCMLHTAL